jgi:hypothetical protein
MAVECNEEMKREVHSKERKRVKEKETFSLEGCILTSNYCKSKL